MVLVHHLESRSRKGAAFFGAGLGGGELTFSESLLLLIVAEKDNGVTIYLLAGERRLVFGVSQ
jgi:hypothetical protein